jgi:hypothetical protein
MKQRLIFLLKEKKQKLFKNINSLFNHQTKILLFYKIHFSFVMSNFGWPSKFREKNLRRFFELKNRILGGVIGVFVIKRFYKNHAFHYNLDSQRNREFLERPRGRRRLPKEPSKFQKH